MMIDLGKMDWKMLRGQKTALVVLAGSRKVSATETEALDGIIALLDHIQDRAAEQVGAESIFGEGAE
jgi:hypothetical protein